MVGSPNGVSKKRPFDRWFRYPAGFSPAALDAALVAAGCTEHTTCVDPFAGSASAGTYLLDAGVEFVGLEAHPLIAELGNLKFSRPGEPTDLRAIGEEVAAVSRALGSAKALDELDLVVRCFDDDVLRELVAIRTAIEGLGSEHPWQAHARWGLLATLRDVASVKVGWPYQRPAISRAATYADPVKRFRARIDMMADDLRDAREPRSSRVQPGDSRLPKTWDLALAGRPADACVSSPPYLNNFDYADATRLEVFFLRQAESWKELCERVRAPMLVATTQQTRVAVAAAALQALAMYPDTWDRVSELVQKLEVERARRGRGKEYDRVMAPYFLGLAQVLACLFDALEPGAKCVWIVGDSAPYGIAVDTPALVLGLAAELGFAAIEDRPMRARGQRWRTNGTRHQVDLTERLVVFQRPSATVV